MYFPLKDGAEVPTSSKRRDALQETGSAQPLLRERIVLHFLDFTTQEALHLELPAARSANSDTTDCT